MNWPKKMNWSKEAGATTPTESPETTGKVLAALLFLGAASGALTLILPHSMEANDAALWTNVAIPAATAVIVVAFASHLRPWMLQLLLAAGTLMVTRAVYYSNDAGSFYSLWYVWVGLFSFFFLGLRSGLLQLGFVALTFGWVLTQLPPASSVVRWLMTIATVVIGGVFVDVLARRVRSREAAARSRARSLEVVSAAAHELARQLTSESVGASICRIVTAASDALHATIWTPTGDGRGLVAAAFEQPGSGHEVVPFVEVGSSVIDAFVSGQRRYGSPRRSDAACLFEPMVLDGVTVAVLAIEWPAVPERLTDELDQVVTLLALEGALALDRAATLARLERVARTDDLTGLANRRSFDEHFTRELARAERQDSPLAIAMLDLDHFKSFNDEHGHPAGDRMLKAVASNWASMLRPTDILARYGGEEFALLLPGVREEEAVATLGRLREAMPANQRVSGGLAHWDGIESPPEMVARADRALYEAKELGRDQVVTG